MITWNRNIYLYLSQSQGRGLYRAWTTRISAGRVRSLRDTRGGHVHALTRLRRHLAVCHSVQSNNGYFHILKLKKTQNET